VSPVYDAGLCASVSPGQTHCGSTLPGDLNILFARLSVAIAEVVSLLLRPCLFLLTVVNYNN
jgi:hypothetical protein